MIEYKVPTTVGDVIIKESRWGDPHSFLLCIPEELKGEVTLPRKYFSKEIQAVFAAVFIPTNEEKAVISLLPMLTVQILSDGSWQKGSISNTSCIDIVEFIRNAGFKITRAAK